jgi:ATP-dependent DNA helicase RecQ
MQLQAGYILDFVKKKLLTDNNQSEVLSLLEYLSYFEVNGLQDANPNDKPELAVLSNLISRGLPTRPSLFIENCLLSSLQLGETRPDSLGSIETIVNQSFNSVAQYLFKTLHIIDPRINANSNRFQLQPSFEFANIGSQYEEDFLFNHAPRILGEEWFQLLESQREFTSIVNLDNNFTRQRADFTVEFPFPIEDKRGIVVEIDGFHHWENHNQKTLDEQRDAAVLICGWMNTLRIETRNFNRIESQLARLKELSRQPFFHTLKLNYHEPLYFDGDGLQALQLTLSPFAIARVQRTLIQLLLQDKLELNSPVWKIAVIERDVPCAALAVADLKQQLKNIFALQDKVVSPEIELTVFTSTEFQSAALNRLDLSQQFSKVQFLDLSNLQSDIAFDVLIDISVLQRTGFSGNEILLQAREKCVVRSAHHKDSTRTFLTSDIISYSNFVTTNEQQEQITIDESKKELLEFFLQNIFRKNHFRAGQLEILNKALQGQSVIGLLPTGGGKSLTYQLAAMLQPGICLVIDPIKSLMKDQIDNLKKNQIDACNFINSSLKTREQKTKETTKLKNGEVLISFVSPERLQMKEFRDILKEMREKEIYFNYCVIDEAHCVSEWGHDFRTSYLSLGKNAIEFCKTKNKETIPLFGLTATASFDVLSDIQRELSGNNKRHRLKEDSIIRFDTVNREELSFEIVDVNADLRDTDNEWKLKEKLGTKKQAKLISLLQQFPFDNQNKYSGIIFCPHRGWYFGVTDRYRKDDKRNAVYDSIVRAAIPNLKLGSFMGSDSDDEKIAEIIEADSIQAQDDFINNNLNLLVSTKAFGMGIDKPNIRFTIHVNYPSSIESFVQEAGRAGRDREAAKCFILFNDEQIHKGDKTFELDRDNLLYFHNSSFKGVEKEKAILYELLSAIHTPNKLFEIEVKLYEQFHQDINVALWQSPKGYWYLFVNGENFEDKFGAVRIPSLEVDTTRTTRPTNECNQVLNFISNFIRQHSNGDITRWLKTSTTIAGLETLLQANERIELTLRFENNITERIEIISKWLNAAFASTVFDLITTKDILAFSNSFEDFKEQVVSKLNNGRTFEQTAQARDNARGNPVGTAERELQRLFDGYRTKADTEKALYRLSTVGVIDDYTVDFNSKTYTVYARRKSDEQYFKNLENYIRKYYSEVRTKQEIRKARQFEGATTIQKCLFFLTDFVYREIEKKRFEGIGVMKEACEIGKESGGSAFKEFVDLYFNSKYARKGYEVNGENKSLTDRTEEGRQQNIKWVWEFIEVIDQDKSGGHINNLKHLRGACVRLLIPQPDNAVFHLLKAFSIFILEPENMRLMDEASNSFAKGFIEFQREKEWTFNEVLKLAEKFKEYVLQFSTHPGIQEIMQNQITILSVKVHSEWLEMFNQKFLEKYESGYSFAS